MKTYIIILSLVSILFFSCNSKKQESPYIFLTKEKTPVYPNESKVTRKVAHLFPGIIVVHDFAQLQNNKRVNLRWHFASAPKIISNNLNSFTIENGNAQLLGQVVNLNNTKPDYSLQQHEFKPPFNLTRQGDILDQHYEPYLNIAANTSKFSVVTLFAVSQKNTNTKAWQKTGNGWQISIDNKTYTVSIEENKLLVNGENKIEISL